MSKQSIVTSIQRPEKLTFGRVLVRFDSREEKTHEFLDRTRIFFLEHSFSPGLMTRESYCVRGRFSLTVGGEVRRGKNLQLGNFQANSRGKNRANERARRSMRNMNSERIETCSARRLYSWLVAEFSFRWS